jgi:acyl-CoA hydrolase
MDDFGSSLERISDRLVSAEAAVDAVKPGHRVFVGTACATPLTLVEALERRKPIPPDVELFHFLTSGLEALWVERLSTYRHRCFTWGLGRARARSQQEGRICADLAHPNPASDGERSIEGRCRLRASVAA